MAARDRADRPAGRRPLDLPLAAAAPASRLADPPASSSSFSSSISNLQSPISRLSLLPLALTFLLLPACSVRNMAVGALGEALAGGGAVFASDDDPELVREALPFALKTTEMLLAERPEDAGLLLAAAQGFTQYAWGFVQLDAELADDWERQRELEERALKLYLRGRDYGLRGLELGQPGIGEELRRDPAAAAARVGEGEVALAYWTGLAWGAAVALGKDRPELLAELGAAAALLRRVAELDPGHDRGGVQEALLRLEAATSFVPGARERAAVHLAAALEHAGGAKASPHVVWAEAVAIPSQNRAGFEASLERTLAVDPDAVPELRLANLLVQRKARHLLENIDDHFLPPDEGEPPPAATEENP